MDIKVEVHRRKILDLAKTMYSALEYSTELNTKDLDLHVSKLDVSLFNVVGSWQEDRVTIFIKSKFTMTLAETRSNKIFSSNILIQSKCKNCK